MDQMVKAVLSRRPSWRASHGRGADAVLLGVKRRDWRARPQGALMLGRKLALRGEVAYFVVSPQQKAQETKRRDQRANPREPARLRSFQTSRRIVSLRLRGADM